jgi:hypothetical protein
MREHNRHLQENAEEVADMIGAVLGKAFRTIATLEQESLAASDRGQAGLQITRFTGEHQWRKGSELPLCFGQSR